MSFCCSCKRYFEPYPVAHPDLEHWPVLLRPSLGYFGMICTQLVQATKHRQTGYLREAFDVWCVCPIHKPVQEYANDDCASDVNWDRHAERLVELSMSEEMGVL